MEIHISSTALNGVIVLALVTILLSLLWIFDRLRYIRQQKILLGNATHIMSFAYISTLMEHQISELSQYWPGMTNEKRENDIEKLLTLAYCWEKVCRHERKKLIRLLNRDENEDSSVIESQIRDIGKTINFLCDVQKIFAMPYKLVYHECLSDLHESIHKAMQGERPTSGRLTRSTT